MIIVLTHSWFSKVHYSTLLVIMSSSPILKLLHEAVNLKIEVSLLDGERYQGILTMIEDNMNIWLRDAIHYTLDGNEIYSESVYIRGSNILFANLPGMISNAPILKSSEATKKPSAVIKKKCYKRAKEHSE